MADVFLGDCPVLENTKLARQTFLLRLHAPAIAKSGLPGQFVMVRPGPAREMGAGLLLKRPFSLHRLGPGEEISLLYRVAGAGTQLLSRVRPGESLELLGPLGHGFDPPRDLSRAYLAAGGIGLAPMLALAEKLAARTELTLFYGAQSEPDVLPGSYLDLFPARLVLTTDDGTTGLEGLVTGPLAEALDREPATVFACGPRPMLARAAALAAKAGVFAQVSLEERMACGLGVCLGCATKTAGGYARVCVEGPVFAAGEVEW